MKKAENFSANKIQNSNISRTKDILYGLIKNSTKKQNELLFDLLKEYRQTDDEERKKVLLARATVVGAYIKRMGNFIFIRQQGRFMPVGELRYAIEETLRDLEVTGAECGLCTRSLYEGNKKYTEEEYAYTEETYLSENERGNESAPISVEEAMLVYYLIESMVETAFCRLDSMLVVMKERHEYWKIIVEVQSGADLSAIGRTAYSYSVTDECHRFTFRLEKEQEKDIYDKVLGARRQKEILKLKTKFHDQMGAGLVAIRRGLSESAEKDEISEAIRVFQCALAKIANRGDDHETTIKEIKENFIRDAGVMGVEVVVNGMLPDEPGAADIFMLVMHECLTNSIRHADATRLSVSFYSPEIGDGYTENSVFSEKVYRVVITNNGRRPDKEIVPGGGLSNLEKYITNYGGVMKIISVPEFILEVMLPFREGE